MLEEGRESMTITEPLRAKKTVRKSLQGFKEGEWTEERDLFPRRLLELEEREERRVRPGFRI